MARPRRCRRICSDPKYLSFIPEGSEENEKVILSVDEYETIRLIDMEKRTQEQCATQMDISRTTVTEIYDSARTKIADCLVNGKALSIEGGDYRLCDGSALCFCQKPCIKGINEITDLTMQQKGKETMRIAVTYENGNVFQHFGHSQQFKIYDAENGEIKNSQVIGTNGNGHGALAGMLADLSVDVLICGGIGGGAKTALAEAGIRLFGGVSGNTDQAVKALLSGKLIFNPNIQCSHHENGNHSCGEAKHNCQGN